MNEVGNFLCSAAVGVCKTIGKAAAIVGKGAIENLAGASRHAKLPMARNTHSRVSQTQAGHSPSRTAQGAGHRTSSMPRQAAPAQSGSLAAKNPPAKPYGIEPPRRGAAKAATSSPAVSEPRIAARNAMRNDAAIAAVADVSAGQHPAELLSQPAEASECRPEVEASECEAGESLDVPEASVQTPLITEDGAEASGDANPSVQAVGTAPQCERPEEPTQAACTAPLCAACEEPAPKVLGTAGGSPALLSATQTGVNTEPSGAPEGSAPLADTKPLGSAELPADAMPLESVIAQAGKAEPPVPGDKPGADSTSSPSASTASEPDGGKPATGPSRTVEHATSWEQECVPYIQMGLYDFTTEPGVGFYLDPGNRWVRLKKIVFENPKVSEMERIYCERHAELSARSPMSDFLEHLEYLKQDPKVEKYCREIAFGEVEKAQERLEEENQPGNRKSKAGRKPIDFTLALGALIVQRIMNSSDRETSTLISESPYIQYFCGFTSHSQAHTISKSAFSGLKKIFDINTMMVINELLCDSGVEGARGEVGLAEAGSKAKKVQAEVEDRPASAQAGDPAGFDAAGDGAGAEESKPGETQPTQEEPAEGKEAVAGGKAGAPQAGADSQEADGAEPAGEKTDSEPAAEDKPANKGVLIFDGTCGPTHIEFPQDVLIIRDALVDSDSIIDAICNTTGEGRPGTSRKKLQKMVTDYSKSKKRTAEETNRIIRKLLNQLKKNFELINDLVSRTGYQLGLRQVERLHVLKAVYGQQMFKLDSHEKSIPGRIVSVDEPFIRPIVRGKADAKTEFGPKYEISVDEKGIARIENFEYNSFNEGSRLIEGIERYRARTGHYPEKVLVDEIYRTKQNRDFCKEHGILIPGPPLGRRPKNEPPLTDAQLKAERKDMAKRSEVERRFSRQKGSFGMEDIMEKSFDTIGHAVGMAVFLDNFVPTGFYNFSQPKSAC